MAPPIPPERVKLVEIGEAYSDVAMVEDTQAMELSPTIVPVLNLPTKPPPAKSGYSVGASGSVVAASLLNFSQVGIANDESVSRSIVRVTGCIIFNRGGTADTFRFLRNDDVSGFARVANIPAYSDAGITKGTGIARINRNDDPAVDGAEMFRVSVPTLDNLLVPLVAIINSGGFSVVPSSVNSEMFACWFFEVFPIIHTQASG